MFRNSNLYPVYSSLSHNLTALFIFNRLFRLFVPDIRADMADDRFP